MLGLNDFYGRVVNVLTGENLREHLDELGAADAVPLAGPAIRVFGEAITPVLVPTEEAIISSSTWRN